MRSKRKQNGATFLGILTIVAILGLALYAVIRLFPMYQEYWAISSILDQTAKKLGEGASQSQIRTELAARWVVDYVTTIDSKQVEVTKVGNATVLRAQYRAEAPFVANVSLVVDFDKSVKMSGAEIP